MALNTNLIPNPSFKDGTTYWAATGGTGTIAASATGGYYGSDCLTVTKSADANVGAVSNTTSITVTVGNTYVASAYIKVPAGEETGSFKVGIGYYTSGNSLIGSISYSNTTSITSTSDWTRVYKTAVAPETSAYAKVYVVQSNTGTANKKFLIDAVQFENSYDPNTFVETLTQAQETAAVNDGLRPVPIPHLTGMELNADIMLNGLLLNTVDHNKCVWVCTGIEGWWGVPDPEVPELTRGLDDGSYDVRGRWTARDMTLTGTILVPNRNYAEVARQRLIEAISLVHQGGWLFVGESPTKAAYVRLSGRPEITNVNARGRMDFSIGLRAANPIKFDWNWNDQNGQVVTTTSPEASPNATITNAGNIDVPVNITLNGPLNHYTDIINSTTDQTLRIVKDLRAKVSIYDITRSSQTGTSATITSVGHGIEVGNTIDVFGVNTSGRASIRGYSCPVTAVTADTVTYTVYSSNTLADGVTDGTAIITNSPGYTSYTPYQTDQVGNSVTMVLYPANHYFMVGDKISVSGAQSSDADVTAFNSDRGCTITAVTANSITYTSTSSRTYSHDMSGTYASVTLNNTDTLEIDTYNKSALFNGSAALGRSYIDAVVDWITLKPGANEISVQTPDTNQPIIIKHRSGWIG
jgi:hypothetical protein